MLTGGVTRGAEYAGWPAASPPPSSPVGRWAGAGFRRQDGFQICSAEMIGDSTTDHATSHSWRERDMADILILGPRKIDPDGVIRMLRDAPSLEQLDDSDRVVVDLRGTEFIDPFGLAVIWTLLRHAGQSAPPQVLLPVRDGTANYLAASRVIEALPMAVSCLPELPDISFRSSSRTIVMGATEVQDDESLQSVRDHYREMLRQQLACTQEYADAFGATVSELCQNILDHSDDPYGGIALAQRYRRKYDGVQFVVLAVADAGIGIRRSLNSKYREPFSEDAVAIQAALQPDYTARQGTGGLGLPRVLQVSREYGGRVDVWSGNASVRKQANGRDQVHSGDVALPGTQLCVSLYCT